MPQALAYSAGFVNYKCSGGSKCAALTNIVGVKATDVADALCIHPVMLYRWRLETRRGQLMVKKKDIEIEPKMRAELKRLQKQEHDLLKKAIQFSLERREKSSNS